MVGERGTKGDEALLSELEEGASARVVELLPELGEAERRRLLDLGLLPGTTIEAELRSPAGDPVAYRVRGALIALRRSQAERIRVKPTEVQDER